MESNFPFNSKISRPAVRPPTPLTERRVFTSSDSIAWLMPETLRLEIKPKAVRGPTPLTDNNNRNISRSICSLKPYNMGCSSRIRRWVNKCTLSPTDPNVSIRDVGTSTLNIRPDKLIWTDSSPTCSRIPLTPAITC